ncbi:magnesium transporter MRS2-I-like isoform X2 [Phalaenopsis equestris]|uniref:magnesium transporter MRS2-I-like isoform X2 n=1 Tax=Phalaenopsis equestris TaxID=78828 RepID=UPI0009E34002|nr:magnesium transporter MRS2-I-like isoform X2 [Phalaenopsis equestris]
MGRDGMVSAAAVADSTMKKTQASRSWVLLDSDGEGTILDIDKYAIMHRVQIHARDLRIIDPLFSYPSAILGREKAIVLNLEHIKAIITANEVMLRDPLDDNVIPVVEELKRRLPVKSPVNSAQSEGRENLGRHSDAEPAEENESPFEFRALEVTLEAICSFLDSRTTELENDAYPALDELTSKISSLNLDRVRKIKSAMTRLIARVQKVRDELEQLLEDDEDMADLYLSRKFAVTTSPDSSAAPNWLSASSMAVSRISRAGKASVAAFRGNEDDVEDLEMIFEAYFMQIDGTLNKLNMLELVLSSGTCSLTLYSLIAGIFGMNIPYSWNDDYGYVFKWVVILSGIASAILFLGVLAYARFRGLIGT